MTVKPPLFDYQTIHEENSNNISCIKSIPALYNVESASFASCALLFGGETGTISLFCDGGIICLTSTSGSKVVNFSVTNCADWFLASFADGCAIVYNLNYLLLTNVGCKCKTFAKQNKKKPLNSKQLYCPKCNVYSKFMIISSHHPPPDGQTVFPSWEVKFNNSETISAICIHPMYNDFDNRVIITSGVENSNLTISRRCSFFVSNSVIHSDEGIIDQIAWYDDGISSLIAWSNCTGVKIFNYVTKTKVSFIPGPKGNSLLVWCGSNVLAIAWSQVVKLVAIRREESSSFSNMIGSDGITEDILQPLSIINLVAEIVVTIPITGSTIAGFCPYTLFDDEDIKVASFSAILVTDGLAKFSMLSNYEGALALAPEDDQLGCTSTQPMLTFSNIFEYFALINMRQIIRIKKRSSLQQLEWLLDCSFYEEAVEAVCNMHDVCFLPDGVNPNNGELLSFLTVNFTSRIVKPLLDQAEFHRAAVLASLFSSEGDENLSDKRKYWREIIYEFEMSNSGFQFLADCVPTLVSNSHQKQLLLECDVYDSILCKLVHSNPIKLLALINHPSWQPGYVFNTDKILNEIIYTDEIREIIAGTRPYIKNDAVIFPLTKAVIYLYKASKNWSGLVEIMLATKRIKVFDVINEHVEDDAPLRKLLQKADTLYKLFSLNANLISKILVAHERTKFPVRKIVAILEGFSNDLMLHTYLKTLFLVDAHAGKDYHQRQVMLWARFDSATLKTFLLKFIDVFYDPKVALADLESHPDSNSGLECGRAILHWKVGHYSDALHILLHNQGDIQTAVDLISSSPADDLWESLICFVLCNPVYLPELLTSLSNLQDDTTMSNNFASPGEVLRRLPDGLYVPNISKHILRIFKDQSIKHDMYQLCNSMQEKHEAASVSYELQKMRKLGVAIAPSNGDDVISNGLSMWCFICGLELSGQVLAVKSSNSLVSTCIHESCFKSVEGEDDRVGRAVAKYYSTNNTIR